MTAGIPRFQAVSVSPDIPALAGRGRVHSVFASTVNLAFPEGSWAVLLPAEKGNGPGFILLFDPPGDFRDWDLAPGAPVEMGKAELRLGKMVVTWDGAKVWTPGKPTRGEFSSLAASLAPFLPSPEGLVEKAVTERANRLKKELAAPGKALARLLGAGPGLTPAGDDFVVGLLAGLSGAGKAASGKRLAEAVLELLGERPGRTTDLSRHFLTAAARGIFCEFFLDFTRAASGGGEAAVHQARRVLGFGASSGAWLLRGFLAGCSGV